MMAAKTSEHPGGLQGQLELFREYALGNFRDLLVEVAKDPAMLVWLDGRTNTRQRPQENFAREIMELFTMGVGFYTEADVYAGARVFHRLESAARRRSERYQRLLPVSVHREQARDDSERIQLSDLSRRQQDDSRAVGGRTGCRTASISSTRSRVIPKPAGAWRGSCGSFS